MAATTGTELGTDTTLKAKVLSTPEVLAQSVANMAPSAAMALLPLFVFFSAGNALWLSFALGLLVMLMVGYCAAQFGKRINSAGSFYVWVTRSLGPGAGHAAGWGLVLGYLFTGMACVLGFEIYGNQFLVGLGLSPSNHVVRAVLYLIGGLGPALVSVLDIRISQRVAFLLEAISVTIILVLCVAVYAHNGGVFDHAQLTLSGFKPGGLVVGMVLAIFAFVGFESAGALGQEARNPARSVPRAIMWSCAVVGAFYLVVSYAQLYGFGAGPYAKASAPLPELADRVGLGTLSHFIAIGITFSMFACALACLTAGSRMLLSFSHDGLAPKALAHTAPKTKAPDFAIWTVAVPMTVIPAAYVMAGSTDIILSSEVGTLATYGFMLAYALVCIAAPLFLYRRRESMTMAALLGGLGVLTMAFVFYVSWIPQLIPNDIFAALAWPLWALPYVFLAWTAIGVVWYQTVRRRNPQAIANAGRWGEQDQIPVPAET
ncbi:MAG TPA: APC family permease [Streptosporangiaceae bacterium]|nr:APC family permease [Streptosporangiaceae bacterium]